MQTSFGKYVLEKKLGQGGMGAVYLALDPSLNRKVALKIITSDDPELLERFQREASAVAKLKHPNIVQVHEAGVIDKKHYFTMDYIEGASLDAIIKSKNKASLQNITKIILQTAMALHYAHQKDIVHRDIKPANILIDKTGKVYIADFGLAKQLSGLDRSLTITGTTVGTPDYMPPEQAMGQKDQIDPRSDIFSLGATLYHCITGRVPFPGKELLEVLTKVVNDDPPAPSSIIKLIPKDLETICLKCLEKDKNRRYQDMAELASDIKKHLQGEPIAARRTSHITKIWQKARKNKALSLSIAGTVIILAAGIAGLAISSVQTKSKLEQYRKEAYVLFNRGEIENTLAVCEKILGILPSDKEIAALKQKCAETIKTAQEKSAIRERAKTILDRLPAAGAADEKIRIAEDALKVDPDFADAYQAIGQAYKNKKDWAKALEYFTRAIKANPGQTYAYYERALLTAYDLSKPEDSLADFKKVLELDPNNHIGYFAKGKIDYEQKRYDESITNFSKAIELYPGYAYAYSARGVVKYEKGDIENALKDCEEALRIKPDDAAIYANRGVVKLKKGDTEGGLSDCEKAIQINPSCSNAYTGLGAAKHKRGDLEGALKDYDKAIEINPNYANAYTSRGVVRSDQGDMKGAMEDHNRTLQIDPNCAKAYANRGTTKQKMAEREQNPAIRRELIEDALNDLNKALEMDPTNSPTYTNRGAVKYKKGDIKGAIDDFDRAIQVDPNEIKSYINRGVVRGNSGDIEGALKDFEQALQIDPNNAEVYNNRGMAKDNTGDTDGAIEDYDKALEIAPNNAQAYTNRAGARAKKGDIKGAIGDWDKVIQINPNDFVAYNNRGELKRNKGDMEGAIADYDKTLQLKPDIPETYTNRAGAKYSKGDIEGALKDFEMALQVKPNFAKAYRNRGTVLYKTRQYESALADLQKAIELNPAFKGELEPIIEKIKKLMEAR